jgi:hypothetical protein
MEAEKGVWGWVLHKNCVHMYVSWKMRHVETILGMGKGVLEPAVGPCLCDLASGLMKKLQGTEAKVSEPDVQKSNSAQGSPDGFMSFRCK